MHIGCINLIIIIPYHTYIAYDNHRSISVGVHVAKLSLKHHSNIVVIRKVWHWQTFPTKPWTSEQLRRLLKSNVHIVLICRWHCNAVGRRYNVNQASDEPSKLIIIKKDNSRFSHNCPSRSDHLAVVEHEKEQMTYDWVLELINSNIRDNRQ